MAIREYFTVDRSPQEVRNLWDWAKEECKGKVEHEAPYAMGVLAAMDYLLGESNFLPQSYKGPFTLKNVMSQSEFNKPVLHDADAPLWGNPKYLKSDLS